MLINIHLLQNYAPSNLNRDDTGAPKDTVFGGVLRGRISSQSLKRSIRLSEQFRDQFKGSDLLAQRTRLFPDLIQKRLESRGVEKKVAANIASRAVEFGRESTKGGAKDAGDSAEDGAASNVGDIGDASDKAISSTVDAGSLRTKQLIFLSEAELDIIADKLHQVYERVGEKSFKNIKIDEITREVGSRMPKSVDIAMFGRMTTSAAFMDVEASVQVAHAISTHRIEQEFDYYTAVDDISGESGAGFIGDTPFNSATYYKYFNIHWEELVKNLADDVEVARQDVLAFLGAACMAHPSGKQNSFAAHNLPDFVLVEIRAQNVPVSYANAFQRPVRATLQQSLMDASAQALVEYVGRIGSVYGLKSQSAYTATFDLSEPLTVATHYPSLDKLADWLVSQLTSKARL